MAGDEHVLSYDRSNSITNSTQYKAHVQLPWVLLKWSGLNRMLILVDKSFLVPSDRRRPSQQQVTFAGLGKGP